VIATDVARLVGMAAEVDPRMPELDRDGLKVWFGLLADVPFDVACAALAEHYRSTSDTITPAVLVLAARTARQRARNAEALEELKRRPPAFDASVIRRGIDRCVAELAASKGLELDAAEGEASWRRMVLAQPCPHCGASVGALCVSGSKPLVKRLAHPGREELAASAKFSS
jgi:hypothetical protein